MRINEIYKDIKETSERINNFITTMENNFEVVKKDLSDIKACLQSLPSWQVQMNPQTFSNFYQSLEEARKNLEIVHEGLNSLKIYEAILKNLSDLEVK